jgi:hypothetical protein
MKTPSFAIGVRRIALEGSVTTVAVIAATLSPGSPVYAI